MWNLTSMLDFEPKEGGPFNMYETDELCQEENSDHDNLPPRGNYSNFSDDESSHTERSIDEYVRKVMQTMIMFFH